MGSAASFSKHEKEGGHGGNNLEYHLHQMSTVYLFVLFVNVCDFLYACKCVCACMRICACMGLYMCNTSKHHSKGVLTFSWGNAGASPCLMALFDTTNTMSCVQCKHTVKSGCHHHQMIKAFPRLHTQTSAGCVDALSQWFRCFGGDVRWWRFTGASPNTSSSSPQSAREASFRGSSFLALKLLKIPLEAFCLDVNLWLFEVAL